MVTPKIYFARILAKLNALFGRGQVVSVGVILLIGLAISIATGLLLEFERDALKHSLDLKRRDELLRHLDHIEHTVNKIMVPASCGNPFYGLREHISFVRVSLLSHPLVMPPESNLAANDHGGNGAI